MISKIEWRRGVPFLVAVALYTLLSFIYFAPQLSGKVLYQHDVKQYEGMTQDILESRQSTGIDPQWTGSMFGGMPAYLINVAYPAQIIKNSINKVVRCVDTPAAFIIFAMLAMWLMLVMMGVSGWVAIVGGLMYGLSTYFFLIIEAGHITKMWALIYAPLMFGGIFMALRGNMWWGAALAALFASAQIGANHIQITYYFAMAIFAFWFSELCVAYRSRLLPDFAKRTAVLAVAAMVAVASNFAPLWYTFQHTPETMRGGSALALESDAQGSKGLDMEYATAWSYGRTESLNMLIPNLVGGSSFDSFSADGAVAKALEPYQLESLATQIPTYWGPQSFTGGPTYIGAVVIFLAFLMLLVANGRQKWWIVAISVIMLLLAWGRHFMWFSTLMFEVLPGYNKFRTVSMTLVVLEWSLPLLAAMALSKLWESSHEQRTTPKMMSRLKWAVAVVGGALLFIIVCGGLLFDFGHNESFIFLIENGFPEQIASVVSEAMRVERLSIMRADAFRSLLLVAACGGVVWLWCWGRLKRGVALGAIALLVVIDLAPINRRYLNDDDFVDARQAKIFPTEIDKEIMRDSQLGYRVLNITLSPFNDATTSYFHRSVGGYHGAKLARYQDLIDHHLSGQISHSVLDMLNTKYIITLDANSQPTLMVNDQALGAAWFIDNVVVANTPHEEIELLGRIDLSSVATVEVSEPQPTQFGEGSIRLVEYEPNYLRYEYSADSPATAIFSEIYYNKGWSATIDGREAPYFRANYLLRGMELPAGSHIVEWHFRAPRWGLIEGVTLLASLLIIVSILTLIILKLNERRQEIKA